MSNSTSSSKSNFLPAYPLVPGQDINATFGAILIGTTISLVIYAFSLVQAGQYFRLYRTDTRFVRVIVCATLFLDLVHTGLTIHACCWNLVASHSDVEGLFHSPWSFQSFNFVSVVLVLVCQLFYARRVYRVLDTRFQWVTLLAAISMISSLALTISLTIQSVRFTHFLVLEKINWTLAWVYGSAMITDIILTTALVIKLLKSRTGWKHTDFVIRNIVAYAASSGLLFTVIAAICFLFTVIQYGNLIYVGISNVAVKVYVFSMLTAIKSRKTFSMRMMEDVALGPAFTTSPNRTRQLGIRLSVSEPASVIEFSTAPVLSVNIHTTRFTATDDSKPGFSAATASDSTVHAQ